VAPTVIHAPLRRRTRPTTYGEDDVGHDYDTLVWDETADLAAFVSGLSEDQWDQPSLCDGWRVRDVIGHMCVGHTMGMGFILRGLGKARFNLNEASRKASIEFGDAHSGAELAEIITGVADDHTRKGIARVIPTKTAFTDHLVHHQDLRRPLGLAREISEERLLAALDSLPTNMGGEMPARKRIKGLRVEATDVDWTHGDGPEVRGPAEAIVLASLGREVALDDLTGQGVDRLRTSVAA
jgi:uncharacterized protein (TIGR03083 family)